MITTNKYLNKIKRDAFTMAKPIDETPTLYGKEARDFLRKMNEPPSKEDIEFRKKCESQRIVLF